MVVYISSVSTFGKYRRIYWKKVRMKTQFSCKVFNIHKRLHKLWPEKISQQESKKGNMEVSPDKAPLMPSHGEWGIRSVKVLAILSHTAKIWHLLDSCSWLLYNSALVTSQLSISKISPYYLVLGQEKNQLSPRDQQCDHQKIPALNFMTAFCCFHPGSAIWLISLFLIFSFGKDKKQKVGFCLVLMSYLCAREKENNCKSTFLKPDHTMLNQQAVGIMR